MQHEEMDQLLKEIGWTAGEAARRLNISPKTMRDMATGRRPIPERIGAWLQAVAAMMRTAPPPP
jgi:plasmid maintenance system antidote protein VapI